MDAEIFGGFCTLSLARGLLLFPGMKTFLVLVLSVTALYLWQRSGDRDGVAESKPALEKVAAVAATPRPVYEHDWAKHSLDRAQEVANQVRETRRQNEQP